MNYIDVYKKRASFLGSTPQERALESGKLEFARYLKYSLRTERELQCQKKSLVFDGVILTDKEDDNRVSQILLTELSIPLTPGDLILWNDQYWIIYQTTTSAYQPYNKFYMVRCNYYIKWVDQDGKLCESWIYLLGSKDSKIKDNFRTWHNAITPQPNKHINILMPHQLMANGTEIMVLDEVWYLVDYDQNSVPGIIFMSFTETNLNEQRDSVEDNLANVDKLATWEIEMLDNRIVAPNSVFDLNYAILKNGVAQNVIPTITLVGNLTRLENNQIQVGPEGAGQIIVTYKGMSKIQQITVGATPAAKLIFIGDDKIRVASSNQYILENAEPEKVQFILNDPKNLVTLEVDGNVAIIEANSKNKLGSFELKVLYDNVEFETKEISVVSLWQVI